MTPVTAVFDLHGNSLWKIAVLIIILLFFAVVGVAHVINPDWFLKRSGLRKGGEMLTEWNRLQFQVVGAIFAAFAGYGVYILLSDCFSR